MSVDLFAIDYERLTEVLITIVVFSFLVERALSPIFENRRFINFVEGRPQTPDVYDEGNNLIEKGQSFISKKSGVRELIAIGVSIGVCIWQGFDAITIITQSGETPAAGGLILTGLIIAGGSKASMGLFKDLLGFMSTAEKERKKAKEQSND